MAMSLSPSGSRSGGSASSLDMVTERFGPRPLTADFQAIHRECRSRRQLYEDPTFPADNSSLFYSSQPPFQITWKRPTEIAGQYGLMPHLFLNGEVHFYLVRGELGDSGVVTAAASLTENLDLLFQTIPEGQSFSPSWYAGVFLFKFWRHGQWKDIIIDDRLPTLQGRLVFIHSQAPNEFWGALLEKAYAKLCGSYEALKSGAMGEVLHDFTAGLWECYNIHGDPPPPTNIVNVLFKALEKQTLISASTSETLVDEHMETYGLKMGHVYTITDLREIKLIADNKESNVTLIRLRNPWGTKIHWSGPWSYGSYEWNNIPEEDRESMGLIIRDEAEFWMNFQDFVALFSTLELNNLPPESPLETPHRWSVFSFHGQWKRGLSAGGRPICKDTHWCNPQYKVSLQVSDEDEDELCSFLVELTQRERHRPGYHVVNRVDIGFVIYKCFAEDQLPLPPSYFEDHTFIERCDFYINTRLVTKRFLLGPGNYVILPTTYEANTEAHYSLRVFCELPNTVESVDGHSDVVDPSPTLSDPQLIERQQQFKQYFSDIAGQNIDIDVYQLRKLINMGLSNDQNHVDISLDACKTMLGIVDTQNRVRLGYFEFLYLWNCIISWKRMFYEHEVNNNGVISSYELPVILASLGYKVGAGVVGRLIFRYADEQDQINLDSFITCMAKFMALMNAFRKNQNNGEAKFTLEKWLECTLVL